MASAFGFALDGGIPAERIAQGEQVAKGRQRGKMSGKWIASRPKLCRMHAMLDSGYVGQIFYISSRNAQSSGAACARRRADFFLGSIG